MTDASPGPSFDPSPLAERLQRQIAELEQRHRIGPGKYCGLTPAEMSRAVVACHSGLRGPGEPAGYWPAVSEDAVKERLRADFGPAADVERLRVMVQFFDQRVGETLGIDWRLPKDEFARAVAAGLTRHYPELSADARRVLAGNFSYSHAK